MGPLPPVRDVRCGCDEAAAEQPPELVAHGYRTWMLGAALADHDGADFDAEQFYVASILHDSGLTEALLGEDFTARSAQAALAVCTEAGVEDDAAGTAIADAVVAHFTRGLRRESDMVGFYVQAGATADLNGFIFWDMAKGQIREAYDTHPSHDGHRKIAALVNAGFHHVVKFSPLRRM